MSVCCITHTPSSSREDPSWVEKEHPLPEGLQLMCTPNRRGFEGSH